MQLDIDSPGIFLDALTCHFIRSTVFFSTWRHSPAVDRACVRLNRGRNAEPARVMCALDVYSEDGTRTSTEGSGQTVHEAVQAATERIERALIRSVVHEIAGSPSNRLASTAQQN